MWSRIKFAIEGRSLRRYLASRTLLGALLPIGYVEDSSFGARGMWMFQSIYLVCLSRSFALQVE